MLSLIGGQRMEGVCLMVLNREMGKEGFFEEIFNSLSFQVISTSLELNMITKDNTSVRLMILPETRKE